MKFTPEKACFGKTSHRSRRDARKQIKSMVRSRLPDDRTGVPVKREDFNCYRCPFCETWHVGHKSVPEIMANLERRTAKDRGADDRSVQ